MNKINTEDYDFVIYYAKIRIKGLEKQNTEESRNIIEKYLAIIDDAIQGMLEAEEINRTINPRFILKNKQFDDWIKKRDKTGNTKEIQFHQLKIHNLRMKLLKSEELDEINDLINKIKTYKDQISELMEIKE